MSAITFARTELAAAIARGVSQCVVIGSRSWREVLEAPSGTELQLLDSETAEGAMARLDKLKATLFVWLGDASAQTADAAMSTLAFIASFPKGSGVLFDYVVERTAINSRAQSTLDSLASRMPVAGTFKYLIQPQAVAGMLRGLGFQRISDLAQDQRFPSGSHLVSAFV